MKKLNNGILEKNNIFLIADDEMFYQVPNWTNYFCSTHGRLVRKIKKGRLKIVNPSVITGGYLAYTLSKPARTYRGDVVRTANGKPKTQKKTITAQRLTAVTHVKYNPYKEKYDYLLDDLDVHHKDHNRQNNYFKNVMWLANGKRKNVRADHQFINTVKRIALYSEQTGKYRTYKDIEMLCKRIDMSIIELIDMLKDSNTVRFRDDGMTVYRINDYFVGVEFFNRKTKKTAR